MMKARYQTFLFLAPLFFCAASRVQASDLENAAIVSEESQNLEEKEMSAKKASDQLQYEDMPLLPIDEISEGQSATSHEPQKKLRFRSFSTADLEAESETRTRQR